MSINFEVQFFLLINSSCICNIYVSFRKNNKILKFLIYYIQINLKKFFLKEHFINLKFFLSLLSFHIFLFLKLSYLLETQENYFD